MSEERNGVPGGEPPEDPVELPEDNEEPEELEPPEDLDDASEPEDPDPQPQPVARSRGSARVQALANENRELKARQAEFERQLRELTQQRREPSPAERAEAERIERERFELLSPWEQRQETIATANRLAEQRTQQISAGLWDQNDRTQYEGLIASNPKLKRYDAEVQELRKAAPNLSRTVLLDYAIGKAARENLSGAETRVRNRTQVERDRNRVTPPNGRADAPADRTRSGRTLEDRLRGQSI